MKQSELIFFIFISGFLLILSVIVRNYFLMVVQSLLFIFLTTMYTLIRYRENNEKVVEVICTNCSTVAEAHIVKGNEEDFYEHINCPFCGGQYEER